MLTPKQRQHLKAQAHTLKPLLHIGKAGVPASLAEELDMMLEHHELVKVKLTGPATQHRKEMGLVLERAVPGLSHVWTIGNILLVFRPSQEHPTRFPLPSTELDRNDP